MPQQLLQKFQSFKNDSALARDYVEGARTRLLAVNDVSKIDIFGAQDEKIYVEFSSQKLAGLRLDRQALIRAVEAQNAVTPAGVVQTSDEEIRVDVTGGFRSEADLRNVNFVANGQIFRLSDIATIKRTYSDPPQPMLRFNGQAAIGIGISMRAGGDVLALGQNIERAMSEIRADLPIGIGGAGPNHAGLSPCIDGSHARQMAHNRSDARSIGGFDIWTALRSSAIFPGF